MKKLIISLFALSLLVTGCGKEPEKADDSLAAGTYKADSFLPGTLSGVALQTMTVLKTKSRVTEYVGSLAESYFAYHLVGMAAAVYDAGDTKISTEIAQFESATDAYGFYARIRPDNARLVKLGAEAYAEGNSLYFTQSTYAVILSAPGEDSSATDVLNRLATTISAEMGSAGSIPSEYALFPRARQIRGSYRYFPSTYMGIERIDRVFTCRYAFAADTLTMFLTRDEQGLGYLAAKEIVGMSEEEEQPAATFGFDEDYQVMFELPDYGKVVAGLSGGYFVGAYNFDEKKYGAFLTDWLTALKTAKN